MYQALLSGKVSAHNGTGNGSVGVAWKRITPARNWFQLDAGVGNGPSAGFKHFRWDYSSRSQGLVLAELTIVYVFRRLTSRMFLNMSGSLQVS